MEKIINLSTKSLTKGEKKIAEYIISNPEKVSDMSALDLGKVLNTSDASIVRFSKNIGFKGFSDLKTYLKIQINSFKKPQNKILEKWNNFQSGNDIVNKVIKSDLKNIESFLLQIDSNKVEEAVSVLLSTKKVFIVGMGCSRGVAQFISWHMKRIGINVELLQESGIGLLESLIHLKGEDSVLLFTFPRYLTDEVQISKLVRKKGAKLILVTSELFSEISMNSDIIFKVAVDNDSFFNSYMVPMELCNIILTSIYEKNKDQIYKDLEEVSSFKDYLYLE
ncbi:MurR/RpiR family transcriptional regulator [Cetobacterium somerae]|uniref:MurR/RpiR family transcriptional regulator n=1 Tax=Cetobacterium sp. NK01 TaxID=2993530 RepID=UPI00211685AB|nr:MurR/RpiR family transcriptional regulator [Cetobacterium sp. NK01]MCQ8211145.1 MurR/RpiR family transcriptional regulator [Cetobacterium sp. NK01]